MSALAGLRRRADFLAAARARRASVPGLLLQARCRNVYPDADTGADAAEMRVGFTCSKKVGNAVRRNRAKRRLREVARLVLPQDGRPGWDYVIIGKRDLTADRPFDQLTSDLRRALSRVHAPKPADLAL